MPEEQWSCRRCKSFDFYSSKILHTIDSIALDPFARIPLRWEFRLLKTQIYVDGMTARSNRSIFWRPDRIILAMTFIDSLLIVVLMTQKMPLSRKLERLFIGEVFFIDTCLWGFPEESAWLVLQMLWLCESVILETASSLY